MAKSPVFICLIAAGVIGFPYFLDGINGLRAWLAFQHGLTLCTSGHTLGAIDYLSKAIEMRPDYVDAIVERGIAYERIGQPVKAVYDLNRAIAAKQDDYIAYYHRAKAFCKLKQYGCALADFRKVAELRHCRSSYIEVCQAMVLDTAGEHEKAAEKYASALSFGKDPTIESMRSAGLRADADASASQTRGKTAAVSNDHVALRWPIDESTFANVARPLFSRFFIDSASAAEESKDAKSPELYFVTQTFDSRWNPKGPQGSNDCGPACLAMAFRYLNAKLPGADPMYTEQFIKASRLAMTGNDCDKVTDFNDVMRGAEAGGLKATIVREQKELDQSLTSGAVVIASGCPNMPDGYGPRLGSSKGTYGHFILVTSKDASGYVICDPMNKHGPAHIGCTELAAFLRYYHKDALAGGIALCK